MPGPRIEHGIFYKPPTKMGKKQRATLTELRADLERAMTNHIERASDLFEAVAKKMNAISIKE